METWIAISVSANLILFFWAVVSTRHGLGMMKDNVRLHNEVIKLSGRLMSEQIHRITERRAETKEIDGTTKKLINLAVQNPNENEARTAALRACQRIHKSLK